MANEADKNWYHVIATNGMNTDHWVVPAPSADEALNMVSKKVGNTRLTTSVSVLTGMTIVSSESNWPDA